MALVDGFYLLLSLIVGLIGGFMVYRWSFQPWEPAVAPPEELWPVFRVVSVVMGAVLILVAFRLVTLILGVW